MGGDRLLDFDAGDVLAAGDDDVLAAVAQLDVAVGMPHGQVPGMEPAPRERLAQIAAICRTRGAALATRNAKDFRETGIDVIDPWQHS